MEWLILVTILNADKLGQYLPPRPLSSSTIDTTDHLVRKTSAPAFVKCKMFFLLRVDPSHEGGATDRPGECSLNFLLPTIKKLLLQS